MVHDGASEAGLDATPEAPSALPAPGRYDGIGRLYGDEGLQRLQASHVMVVGLGGVGSWTVEALARSGVGRLTLVDLDEICLGNTNRQLHTLTTTVGRSKAEVLAERVHAIDPGCQVEAVVDFFTASSAAELLDRRPDVVVDAIDSPRAKVELVVRCRERGMALVVCGGAGGRIDPLALRRGDLAESGGDGLLRGLRRALRVREPSLGAGPWGLPAVWSVEPQRWPDGQGCVSTVPPAGGRSRRLDCAEGFGAATMVTGSFGFALAALAVEQLLAQASGRIGPGAKTGGAPGEIG